MNKKIFYLILVLFCACTNTDKPLTDTEKESIINETKGLIGTIMQTCESPDPEALKSLYINSTDFVSMVGGNYAEYEESLKGVDNYFAKVKSQKATILSEKYVVLDPVTVLYTAKSNWEVLLKNDSTVYMDPVGMQFLLRKTDGQWKVLSWTEEIKMK